MGALLGKKKKKKSYDIKGERYVHEKLLAEGGFSFVYLVHGAKQKNKKFAVKRISIQTQDLRSLALKEIELHQAVNHHNVMPLIAYEIKEPIKKTDTAEAWLLFPYISQGSLFDLISTPTTTTTTTTTTAWPYSEREAMRIFNELCCGVFALHSAGRCHRDVKPHNVMLSGDIGNPTPIITDFGSNEPLSVTVTTRQQALTLQEEAESTCTRPYRPPELHDVKSECVLDGKTDVWMLGCTLFALLFGYCPFEDPMEGVMTLWILSGTVKIPEGRACRGVVYSEQVCDFILRLLRLNPKDRPTLDEVISLSETLSRGKALPPEENKEKKKKKKKKKKDKKKKGQPE